MNTSKKYDETKIEYASFIARWVAFTVDNAILALATLALLFPFTYFEDALQVDIQRTLTTVLLVSIMIYLWVKWDGATPGKKLMKIKIVDADNFEIVGFAQAAKRFAGYILSSIPLLAGFVMVFFTKKKQCLHDKVSNTVVVYSDSLVPKE
ncbi:MAG: RDD family protein [Sulfurimonas sp.]|nr:RDD family protein [Sulfurimonas sp.]